MKPLLPVMANKLASGFAQSKQGSFLWVTSSILREFSEERELVDPVTTNAIYTFFEAQTTTALRMMSNLDPKELPDIIEDFFRLLTDAILYFNHKLIPSQLFSPIFQAAISALSLEQRDPLTATLHYIRDVISYGGENPASSGNAPNPPEIQLIVKRVLVSSGPELVKSIMAGMMISFPRDCFADGSGALLSLLELMPDRTAVWIGTTVKMLPAGTITPVEAKRFMDGMEAKLREGQNGIRGVRSILQDFTNNYRRRYVAPRDGLGPLEARRFRFSG